MKAVRLHGAKDLRLEDIEKPTVGPDEFLVRVKAATVCATDIRMYTYGDSRVKLPRVLGHEFAGDVEKVGANLRNSLKVGMRVTANPNMYCGRCKYCIAGRHELWGAYAEYIRVPARIVMLNTQEIPPSVTYEEAAITEPLACVLHGIEEAHIKLGDTIAIIGAGPIGLLHLLSAKKMGT